MSWPRRPTLAVVALLGLAGCLAGCGFRPLYGTAGTSEAVATELAAIEIRPIPDREGQILRNYLIERLNPAGRPERPAYALTAAIDETEQQISIESDSFATRANLLISAEYALLAAATGAPVTQGWLQTITSFDILRDEFATLAARRAARDRALRQLAEDIRLRIGLYFQRAAALSP